MGSNFMFQIGLRIFASILIVLITYNPSGFSYIHWVKEGFDQNVAVKVLTGLLLIIAYAVLFRSTLYSIGMVGAGLAAALVAAIVWVMVDVGILSLQDPGVIDWVILLGTGFVLGVGLSWAIIRRRLSGQYTVDEPGIDYDGDNQ